VHALHFKIIYDKCGIGNNINLRVIGSLEILQGALFLFDEEARHLRG
jgi:hypothetical protein